MNYFESILQPIKLQAAGKISNYSEYIYVNKTAYRSHELNDLKIYSRYKDGTVKNDEISNEKFTEYFSYTGTLNRIQQDSKYKNSGAKEFPLAWLKNSNYKNKIYSFTEDPQLKQAKSLSGIYKDEKKFQEYVQTLIPHSFGIHYQFKLTQPFYSKDDDDLYIIQNPILKEKVFKVPMMRGSSWKGVIANAGKKIIQDKFEKNDSGWRTDYESYIRIFGTVSESEKDTLITIWENSLGSKPPTHKGHAIFYPTYFNQLSLEIINPHDRKTKAGTNPIHYEVVPTGTEGIIQIVYIPFGLIQKTDEFIKKAAEQDEAFLRNMVERAITEEGFGAKTKYWGRGVING